MDIYQYIEKNGQRKTAIKLVSDRVYIHCGLTISELPDSLELCNLYDEIEPLLSDWDTNKKLIFELLDEIDFDFIEFVQ
jgi:hypothetical protein